MISDEDWARLVRLNGSLRAQTTTPARELRNSEGEWPGKEALDAALDEFGLTSAEHDVAVLIVFGESPQEIADFRGRSICTVNAQIRRLYAAANVSSREKFTAEAIRRLYLPRRR